MTQFRIEIIADPSGVVRGGRVVERTMGRVEGRATRLRQVLARTFALVGTGVGITAGVRTLADFSQALSTVQAISRATESEFAALEERAIQLGTNTRFSASQAADGMIFLARAGFDANEVFETVDDTLRLAQAGALGLGEAADIASNVLTGFRLETDQAGRVVDVLALAANSANTDVSQLGQALKFVAPIAAGVGVSVEETTAAISALSNAGLQASLAGTGLRRILSELESVSPKTEKTLNELGLTAADVRVSQVGLTTALQRLADAGVDTGLALEIFGDRGGPAFEVLRSSIPAVEEMTEALGEAEGTAARIAETMDDNLNGAILAARSAFEGLTLRLGQSGATGALRSFFDTLTLVLRSAAENVDSVVRALEGLAFVLGVTLAKKAIPAAIGALRSLTAAAIANPFTAIFAVVTLVIGAIIAFRKEIADLSIGGRRVGDVFTAVFGAIRDRVIIVARVVTDFLGFAFEEIGRVAVDAFNAIGRVLPSVLRRLSPAVNSFFDFFVSQAKFTGNAVLAVFATISDVVGQVLRSVTRIAIQFATLDLSNPIAAVKSFGSLAGVAFEESFKTFDRAVKSSSENFKRDFIGDAIGTAKDAGTEFLKQLKLVLSPEEYEVISANFFGDVNERLAKLEGERAARNFLEQFQVTLVGSVPVFLPKPIVQAATPEAPEQPGIGEDVPPGIDAVGEAVDQAALRITSFRDLTQGVFRDVSTAIVDFAETGEASFKDFSRSLLGELKLILAQKALLALLDAFTGGGASAGTSFLGAFTQVGAAQEGADVSRRGEQFIVGEDGPELFTTPSAGRIVPAGETAAMLAEGMRQEAPVVNVAPPEINIRNVVEGQTDEEREGEVLNIIQRKRRTVKGSIG